MYRLFRSITIVASAACLAGGYLLEGMGYVLLIIAAIYLPLLLSRYRPGSWLPGVFLGGYLFLAALGVCMGLSSYLMIYGSITALVGWEMGLFRASLAGDLQHEHTALFQRLHFKALGQVVVASILLTTLGLNLEFRLPFGLVVALVLLAGFALDRGHSCLNQEIP